MALAIGQTLQDRYRIDKELAQGGMAAVYSAWDTHLDLPVAVKAMIPQPRLGPKALAQLRRQFKREAHILARINHPNLVRVTDSFSQDDSEYLVMNFVEGESLGDRVDRMGALPEAQVLIWADQLLSALAYCHSQGVIHRDVKSHNVIIRPDGQAVLVDFGLVKLWDPNDPSTKTVMRGLGTPAFAPPEQFEADAEHTDERSDVYSLGATLYHALSGTLPPTVALRTATPETFVSLRSIVPDVSPQTETVVMKAMEPARSKRWQSTDEMAEALKTAERSIVGRHRGSSSTVALRRGGTGTLPGGQAAAKGQRKRVPLWVGALSIVALLLAAGGLAIGLEGIRNRSTPMPSPESTTAVFNPATLTERAETGTGTPVATATLEPTDTPSPMPTPTVTSTPSLAPTSSPAPQATLSPTRPPTLTPGRSIPGRQQRTGTPTPMLTPTLTRTPTPTEGAVRATATPVATPTPTVKPTAALPQLYQAPKLIEPISNQSIGFDQRQIIHLLWTPVSLTADQWYEVQLQMEEDEGLTGRHWTKENWWDMGPDYYRPGDYAWRVIVVQGKENDVVGAVSPPSETWYLRWVPVAPTRVPQSKPTNTPRPQPTNTPKPPATNTPKPPATNTPRPTESS